MTRVVFIILISFLSAQGFSQTSDLGNWLIYFGNKKIDKDWNWHHEVQYRNYNAIGDLEQFLLRTGIGYNLTENNNNILLGYGFINSQNYIPTTDEKKEVNEHRIYQQFITRQKIGRVNVQHRYRFEQRWIESQDFRMRFRYFLALNVPINNKEMIEKTFYLRSYNEIFLNHKNNVFDRNRLYGGVGFKLNKLARFEIGYMNQFLSNGNRDQINLITFLLLGLGLVSCKNETSKDQATNQSTEVQQEKVVGLVQEVLTKEEQEALTPNMVIQSLKEGNERFMRNDLTARDHSEQVRKSTNAQFPKAIVLSCVDSRIPVEDVFDRGIGDIFVARVAGNFVNEDILGSMEFACKVSGSKLVLVMGHEHCGAVKAAVDDVKLGNITPMLSKIRPAVDTIEYDGDRTSKNQEFVHMACESNVKNTIEQIRKNSPILKEMEDNGEIKIIGAVYDMDDGSVDFLK